MVLCLNTLSTVATVTMKEAGFRAKNTLSGRTDTTELRVPDKIIELLNQHTSSSPVLIQFL